MKKNDFEQIKGLDVKELRLKVSSIRQAIANLVMDKNMKKLKDLRMISKKRKELAQVLTILKQKQQLGDLEARVKSLESSEEKVSKDKKIVNAKKPRKEKTST